LRDRAVARARYGDAPLLRSHVAGRDNAFRPDGAHIPYGYAGENLALDRDVASAHRALLGSHEHRGNMLEAHYARVGIAAVGSADGEIFVEDFSD
jgi:uncharacterized protein YkwD